MKKMTIVMLMAVAMLAFTGRVSANIYDEKYFAIDESSIKIELLEEQDVNLDYWQNIPSLAYGPFINRQQKHSIEDTVTTIDELTNLMEKLCQIVEDNKPVVNINTHYANAVPVGITHWTELQNWSKPGTKTYAFSVENYYGIEVVNVVYQVRWIYGGNLDGKGKFLTGVTVDPISVVVAFCGYNLDLVMEVPDSTIVNMGTSEDPIASMQIVLKWKISTILGATNGKAVYHIQGDGYMKHLTNPL